MAPNLLVATQTLFTPHRWFVRKNSDSNYRKSLRKSEHWSDPVPGIYEYIPGRGWYLTQPDNTDGSQGSRLEKPKLVTYSRVLRRYLFNTEYELRKLAGEIKDANGKIREVGFFQLDDGVAWVNCWDHKGDFVPGPYERWCIDERTEKFRKMLKGDDPAWRSSRRNSRNRKSEGSNKSADSSGDERDKHETYNIPRKGHSRPASTLDFITSPACSRPASPERSIVRSEGHTRSNSLSGSTAVQPLSQPITQPGSRHDSTRGNSNEDVASAMSKRNTTPTGTSGLAAAVSRKLEAQEHFAERREHGK